MSRYIATWADEHETFSDRKKALAWVEHRTAMNAHFHAWIYTITSQCDIPPKKSECSCLDCEIVRESKQ